MTQYEAVIGLEVHVQLKTNSKMFTRCKQGFGMSPNTLVDEVILALPGVLPVLNKEAILKSIKAGLIFGCKIPSISKWDRKNYFYPDSPKNYQLSQFDEPLCMGGEVEIELPASSPNEEPFHKNILLTRIHLEEDVGKLTHCKSDSLVDYNRAGTPLIEIVSEPDMHNENEAFAYLNTIKSYLTFCGLSECDMEKGQLRCDANISIRPVGQTTLGTKVEIKNMNSISGVRNGIKYEIVRQKKCIEKGEPIIQETRRWNAELSITQSMRTKEKSHDYRYFPDPDLMPVKISDELIKSIAEQIPELPYNKQRRYAKDFGIAHNISTVICHSRSLSDFFEKTILLYDNPKSIANILVNDVLKEMANLTPEGEHFISINDTKLTPAYLASIAKIIQDGTLSKQMAKDVLTEVFQSGNSPEEIIKQKGLSQNSNTDELEEFCKQALSSNAKAVAQYKEGNEKAINSLIGPVMKLSGGKANPKIVLPILKKLIENM